MSQVSAVKHLPPGNCIQLSGIDWCTYSRLLRIFSERPNLRLTYDRGLLEIMTPLLEHDDDADFLGTLVRVLTEELDLPVRGGGSVTIRRRRRGRGLEPDRCFWIVNAPRMVGRRVLNLRRDPPPDLAIEVDVSHSSMDRLPIYAALKVPEVWRLEGRVLTFHVLGPDGVYTVAHVSRSFPLVSAAEILSFVELARQSGNQNDVVRRFREWIRQRRSGMDQPRPIQ